MTVIDWRDVRHAIWDWFSAATGLETIWADQNAPQPSYPYASLNLIAGSIPMGARDEEQWTTDGGVRIVGQRDLTVSCQVHAGPKREALRTIDALALVHEAISSLARPDVKQSFAEAGLGVRERGTPQSIDILVGADWISRQNFDLRLGLASVVDIDPDSIGWFDKAAVSSDFEGLDPSSNLNLDDEIVP